MAEDMLGISNTLFIDRRLRRLAGLLAGVVGLALGSAEAAPADAIFTVGNYPVEARADNAVAAKDKALADGQRAAFRSLLKRLVPVTAHPRLKNVRVAKPGDLIEGIRVRAERNSATDYIASLDFAFQPRAIRALLQQEGLPIVEEQAPEAVVIPVWRSAPGTPPKDEPSWTGVWKGLDLEHALSPVKLVPLKPEMSADAVAALANGDGAAIRSLVNATRSELIVVALAEPDAGNRKLMVTLAGRDAVGAFTLKRAYRIDPSDPSYAAELAGVVSLGVLEGRWKAIANPSTDMVAAPPPPPRMPAPAAPVGYAPAPAMQPPPAAASGGAAMQVSVEFSGMAEWQNISRRLAATPGLQNLDVAGLSARGARVTFSYAEGPQRLVQALEAQGLALRNSGGAWVLSAR
ncbi:MAG: DUF2066 domain-containing protein [Hyphomicrobiales bacterium]|nr:MAG: DUF2066 domain-containing protein [Hyphomicrobiales bacterium]